MSSDSVDPTGLIVDYCAIASTALLWYDFALTFSTEVERIWKRKYTGATFVFIVLRYSSLAESIFFVLASWLWNTSDRVCGVLTHSNDVFTILSDLSAALITILRVYGISVKDWRLLALVAPAALVYPTLSLIKGVNYYTIQGGPPWGCLYAYSFSNDQFANIVIASVVCAVGANVILIILTWCKTYSIRKDSRELGMVTPLSTLLIKDGTMFFLLLIANILMTYPSIKSSLAIFLVWPFFNRVFTVMILTRFMLDLRGVHLSNPGPGDSSGVQSSNSLVFRALPRITSTIVGNLAATIRTNGTESRAEGEWGVQEDEPLASLDVEPEGEQYSNDPFKAGMSG